MNGTALPGVGTDWFKAHGLGNDYLVFEAPGELALTADAIREICARHTGVGGDGIVVLLDREARPFPLRMFNPDGSEFERSGNGLRVLAVFLAREGLVSDGRPFRVRVGGDTLEMTVHGRTAGGLWDVSVEMGRARFPDPQPALGGVSLPGPHTAVSVGNPHCVFQVPALDPSLLEALGPALNRHPDFPEGVNVQLMRPVGEREIEIRIWERGVGPTSASGTSASAVAAAAVRRGVLSPGPVQVSAPGGTLVVEVASDLRLTLRGPVQAVSHGALDRGFSEALGSLLSLGEGEG